jgi:predicted PurR-regulated permease PerM
VPTSWLAFDHCDYCTQGLHVHPIIVLLAVIGGGQIAGLTGVVFAVPALAVFRVFFDFFRIRIRTSPDLRGRASENPCG